MTLVQKEKEELIRQRIAQAKNTLADAEFLIEHDKLTVAVNRIYYGMFYMVSALALQHDFHTSKHHQLIGWFNKNFVKPGRVAAKYAKMLTEAFERRSESDYGVFVTFAKEDVLEMFAEMQDFIATLEQLIISSPPDEPKVPIAIKNAESH